MTEEFDHSSSEKQLKRKRAEQVEELEIDINAAEPPSKKQLRKAKKGKTPAAKADSSDNINSESKAPTTNDDQDTANTNTTTSASQPKNPNHTRSKHGIWIGNLTFATTKDELLKFITGDTDHPIDKDNVTRLNLPNGPTRAGKPQNKGFAYIDFTDETTLNHALNLSEKLFNGRRVLIKNATSFEGRPSATKEEIAAGKPASRRIFVGNLSFDTTSEDIEKHFGPCGKIAKVQVATFEDSGKCKGYAWVEFEQLPAAESAIRGWVEQPIKGKESKDDDAEGQGDLRKRRVWLKKMDGRALRMEFAEDATTRYNKRYGKDAKGKKTAGDVEGDGEQEQQAPIEEVEDTSRAVKGLYKTPKQLKDERNGPSSGSWKQKQREGKGQEKGTRHGYEKETVQRLTGAITEAKGSKVVFD